ncbi:MAG: 2-oxoacid:acceptor oxidoreductase family protein [Candidatus Aenigmarchaeota archaeon]|nr:2-oxoacid:acceptor oxidoreductase family protein [Candidatus Aenigmarchaeota archaeon]
MKNMIEIRIHGRGGQGAKTAAQFIVESAITDGKHIQAFPEYGPERTGAPMKTYARISDNIIKTHEAVAEPDIVMVIDPTLLDVADVSEGMTKSGILIVNSTETPEKIKQKTGCPGKVYTIDATGISIDLLGTNMPNMPILGALSNVCPDVKLDVLTKSVRDKFLNKIGEEKTKANIEAMERAHRELKG